MYSGRSRSAKRPRRQGGFSIVEVLVATSLVTIGLLGLSASTLLITRSGKTADWTSAATALATKRLELLRSEPLDADPDHKPGTYTGGTFSPSGASGGPISVNWVVSDRDVPISGLKTITVTSSWTDGQGTHAAQMAGFVRCSTVPCRVY
jgi:Tfp pilus assembly protein PilV